MMQGHETDSSLCFAIFLTAALLAFPAYGQHMNEKDSPCVNVVVTAELTKCLSDARDRADTKLNSFTRKSAVAWKVPARR
jgi:hypothetical protein